MFFEICVTTDKWHGRAVLFKKNFSTNMKTILGGKAGLTVYTSGFAVGLVQAIWKLLNAISPQDMLAGIFWAVFGVSCVFAIHTRNMSQTMRYKKSKGVGPNRNRIEKLKIFSLISFFGFVLTATFCFFLNFRLGIWLEAVLILLAVRVYWYRKAISLSITVAHH